MSADLRGSIGFLDVGNQSADVSWLCILTSPEQVVPEVKIQRLVKNKPDAKVKLTLTENGTGGGTSVGPKGEVSLIPKNPPTTNGALFISSFTLAARAGGPDVVYVMSARTGQDDFVEVARISATSFQRPDLNTSAPVTVLLQEAPVPRLAVGINQAVPREPGKSYKGFTPSEEDASQAITGAAKALQSLLFRLFVILDTPQTLDPVWDQQSLTNTVDSLSEARFAIDKVRVAEELLARQVTEMLAFTPYGGPSAQYGGGCTDLELIATGIQAGAQNPRYGIWYGCQHLANFGVLSRGLQKLATSKVFPNGILLEASARCVDAVMQMPGVAGVKGNGAWIDSSNPPKARATQPGADPGLLSNGGTTVDLTSVITGTFPSGGINYKYQPGSVHLFSNRATRKNDAAKYDAAIQKLNDKVPQGKATFCTIVTVGKGDKSVGKPTVDPTTGATITPGVRTGLRELCVNVSGLTGTHEQADVLVSKATGRTFIDHNTAAPIPPHLGFALRTRKNRVQFFDTGGFSVSSTFGNVSRTNGVTAVPPTALFHGGNYDDPLGNQIHGAHPFRGTGIFPPVDDTAAGIMHDHVINVLRKARPLGVAKFVLLRRDPAQEATGSLLPLVVYSSPLLNMYDGSSNESNYAISRYMWSLRNLPGAANMTAVWLIYSPLRELAAPMRDAARSASIISIASGISGLPVGSSANDRRLHDFIFARINPAVQVVSQADGTVRAFIEGKGSSHPSVFLIQQGKLMLDRAFRQGGGPNQAAVPNQPTYFNG